MIRHALLAACLSACAAPGDQGPRPASDSLNGVATVASPPAVAPAPPDSVSSGGSGDRIFDKALSVIRAGESACHHFAGLTIVAKDRAGLGGTDLFIREGPEAPCTYDSLPGDWVLRNEWAEYFMGMADSTLMLDSGTGIVRAVIFWSIPRRAKYYEGEYSGEILERGSRELGLWRVAGVPLASKGCAEESQAVVERVTWVEVATGKETPGEEYRCGFRE